MSEHYTVFKRRFSERQSRYGKQGIKPTSCLVYRLAYEIGRKILLELVGVFKRIMPLSKRHRAAVKPAIAHFGHSDHLSAAFAVPRYGVDIRTVKLDILFHTRKFFEFLSASYNVLFAALVAYPDRQWRSPISLTGYTPVYDVFEEVAHSARSDCRRHPVDRSVRFQKSLFNFRHFYKPARASVV